MPSRNWNASEQSWIGTRNCGNPRRNRNETKQKPKAYLTSFISFCFTRQSPFSGIGNSCPPPQSEDIFLPCKTILSAPGSSITSREIPGKVQPRAPAAKPACRPRRLRIGWHGS